MKKDSLKIRYLYLTIATLVMLFAGVLYAWSILKNPFSTELLWENNLLALNYTLTMCFFCLGGLLGAFLSKKTGVLISLFISAVCVGAGFCLTALASANQIWLLFISYGVLAGTGIGVSYNVVISTVNKWFPDKKGLCTGCLMLGFGASTLVLGNVISKGFALESVGWRNTYLILGASLFAVITIGALILKPPSQDVVFPSISEKKNVETAKRDYTTLQMIKTPSFWMCFVVLVLLSSVGSSAISFAFNLSLFVGSNEATATTLVGVLSIFNGIGRILTGASFDFFGRRKTMLIANAVTVLATVMTLLAVIFSSIVLLILGLVLIGVSYGTCSTTTSVYPLVFYGKKHFSTNLAVMTFNVMGGSLLAMVSNTLVGSSGGYVLPFIVLSVFTVVAFIINFFIKKA